MKALIVNADDFGLTTGVNRAIIEAHTRGILTSATIMANMPAFDDAVCLAKAHPSLGVGLHFNITQGHPIAEPARVRSLLDQRGEFLGTSTALLQRALLGRLRVEEIRIELRAQIEKSLSAGLPLTHVDSHKHAHAFPPVFSAIADTISEFGICAVRLPCERWRMAQATTPKLFKQGIVASCLSQFGRVNGAKLRRANLKSTDAFFGIVQTGFWSEDWLIRLIASLPEGTSELMSHPGYEDQELARVKTRLRQSRLKELSLLTAPKVVDAVQACGVRLVSYARLGGI